MSNTSDRVIGTAESRILRLKLPAGDRLGAPHPSAAKPRP